MNHDKNAMSKDVNMYYWGIRLEYRAVDDQVDMIIYGETITGLWVQSSPVRSVDLDSGRWLVQTELQEACYHLSLHSIRCGQQSLYESEREKWYELVKLLPSKFRMFAILWENPECEKNSSEFEAYADLLNEWTKEVQKRNDFESEKEDKYYKAFYIEEGDEITLNFNVNYPGYVEGFFIRRECGVPYSYVSVTLEPRKLPLIHIKSSWSALYYRDVQVSYDISYHILPENRIELIHAKRKLEPCDFEWCEHCFWTRQKLVPDWFRLKGIYICNTGKEDIEFCGLWKDFQLPVGKKMILPFEGILI
jgi:hypothetical protein